MSEAQCALCMDTIDSHLGFTRCSCKAIAVDDGRYLAEDLRNVLIIKDKVRENE
jgi:hypothetical protein